jgi:hypothetical protein
MPLWASLFCVFWVFASGFSLFTYARYHMRLAMGEAISTLCVLGLFGLNYGILTLTGPALLAAALILIGYIGWFQLYAARPVMEGEIARAEAEAKAQANAQPDGGDAPPPLSRHLIIGVMVAVALPMIYVAVELILKALSGL